MIATVTSAITSPQIVNVGESFLLTITFTEQYLAIADVQVTPIKTMETIQLSKMAEQTT